MNTQQAQKDIWAVMLFSWTPLVSGIQCIPLAGEYPWICCSIPQLRQGIFPIFRLLLVNSNRATKLHIPQQQRDGTDGRNWPKPPPLLAQVEAAVIYTEDVGKVQDAENISAILNQSRSEHLFFFFSSETKASTTIRNYNILSFQ